MVVYVHVISFLLLFLLLIIFIPGSIGSGVITKKIKSKCGMARGPDRRAG